MTAIAETLTPTLSTSTRARWVNRVLTAIPTAFLAFSGVMKFLAPPEVTATNAHLGIPNELTQVIGVLELGLVVLYLIPRTAVLGAVLLTGYLGGAVAIHLRVGDPLATHTLFPIYVGALLWAALYLRDARVRGLLRPAVRRQ